MTAATVTAFACEGWYDANGQHHACTTDNPKPQAKGRCGRCYAREYSANNGKVRPPEGADRPALSVVPAATCAGWDGSDGTHHPCKFPEDDLLDNRGRCQKCARMQRGADLAREMTEAAPPPAQSLPAAPADTPQPATAPVLRSRHIRPVMSFAVVCANCDGPLVQGDQQTIGSYVGKALTCRECGASWRIEAASLSHWSEQGQTASDAA